MADNKERVSVIIPTKNAEKGIRQCLEAVFDQSFKAHEVIIVDGHSTDGTLEIVREFPAKICYEDFCSRGGGRQMGLIEAEGYFVAFTDADCIPERDWLKNLVTEFEGDVVGVGGPVRDKGSGLFGKSFSLVMNTFLGSANSVQGRIFKSKRFVTSISGCNSIYRKAILLEVGGFDVSLSINEDTEINHRLLRVGRLLYEPNAIVVHEHHRNILGFARQMYAYGAGRAKTGIFDLQVVPPLLFPFLLLLGFLAPWFLLAVLLLYVGIVASMGLVIQHRERDFRLFFSVLLVYLLEHSMYTVGFWFGLFAEIRNVCKADLIVFKPSSENSKESERNSIETS